MNTKHTPGPWTLCNDGHETQSTFLVGTNENPDVARVYDITKEAPANAKLIAAAPELLEALQRLTDSQKGLNLAQWEAATKLAVAAIAKATK